MPISRNFRISRYVLFFLCLSSVVACQPSSPVKSLNERYIARLSNVLDTDPAAITEKVSYAHLPAAAKLQVEVDSVELSLFDLNKLSACGLQSLVAERNTTLGKLQSWSQRLIYENAVINRLTRCALSDDWPHDLHQTLTQSIEIKREQIAKVFWNMLVSDTGLRQSFDLSPGHYTSDSDSILLLVQALEYLTQLARDLKQNGYVQEQRLDTLEHHLGNIAGQNVIGSTLTNLQFASRYLIQARLLMKDAVELSKCQQNKASVKAEYLSNIFHRYYVQDVQANNAELQQVWLRIHPLLAELYSSPVTPDSDWFLARISRQTDYHAFMQENRAHAQQWQAFFKLCNITPN